MPPDNSPQRKEEKKRKGRKEIKKKHGNRPTIISTVPFFDWPQHEGIKINPKINQMIY